MTQEKKLAMHPVDYTGFSSSSPAGRPDISYYSNGDLMIDLLNGNPVSGTLPAQTRYIQ